MPNIDNLDIQIKAQASNAITALDSVIERFNTLEQKLGKINTDSITGLANGIDRLSRSMQGMNNIKTSDFSKLTRNISKLGNINVSAINSAASSMSHITRALNNLGAVSNSAQQVGELAKSISKLGYKSVTNAITNIPLLSSALKDLMTTLSQAPTVSKNVIDMTNALANLSAQGSKVGNSTKSIVNGLNGYSTSAQRATKKSFNLASAIGRFYATYFVAVKGIKGLWKSVESSMDYIETLNYFDAAFGQVADSADLSQWKSLGYESAEEYYDSFSVRAKELTSKMSGFSVNPDGTLAQTGEASLGIDPNKVMQYQAIFGQMSSSMGVTAETSLKLSDALTKIGADLASVKNMDFEDVWKDMASGLAGMSRTLDKYGVNIRNVNLQQKLTELGINANIQSLNQNDKALLRTIILLDNTTYAWGDLADTINQPANQLRLLQSNWENLTRTIGNLFIPVIQKTLPYLNGLTIALQRLFTWVGTLFNLNLGEITDSMGDGGDKIGDLLGDSEGLEDSLDGAASAAKKLKNATLGIDELNINAPQEESSSNSGSLGGIGGGILDSAFDASFSEYQKKWQEAYDSIENRAQEIADKFERMFEPVKNLFENLSIGNFFGAGQDTSNLVVAIFDFFARAIDDIDWEGIGTKIGEFLAGLDWIAIFSSIGELIWQGINAGIELWSSTFDAAPIETTILTGIGLLTFTPLGGIVKSKIITALTPVLTSIGTKLGEPFLAGFKALFGSKAAEGALAFMSKISKAITGIGSIIGGVYISISNFFDMWNEGFSWLNEALMIVGIGLTAVGAVILGAPAAIAAVVAGIVAVVATGVILLKDNWEKVVSFFELACEKIGNFFSFLWDGIKKGAAFAINGVISFIENGINHIISIVNLFIGGIGTIVSALGKVVGQDIEIPLIPKVSLPRIDGFEFGGYPEKASLFWANENGIPELVGTIGGRTAVASGSEITGIKDEIQYMRQSNEELQSMVISILQVIADKDTSVNIDGRELVSAYDSRKSRNGYALRV